MVSSNCPTCGLLKETLKKAKGNFEEIDIDSPEGKAFIEKHGVSHVPECYIVIEVDGKETVRSCTDKDIEDLLG